MYNAAVVTWWARLVRATCVARKELAVHAVVIPACTSA